jgi:hypothetical protein
MLGFCEIIIVLRYANEGQACGLILLQLHIATCMQTQTSKPYKMHTMVMRSYGFNSAHDYPASMHVIYGLLSQEATTIAKVNTVLLFLDPHTAFFATN